MNRFAGLSVDDVEISNKFQRCKIKRKLNKILRQIEKLKKKTNLSHEEKIKVGKENYFKEELNQLYKGIKIPKKKSYKKYKLKRKRERELRERRERERRERERRERGRREKEQREYEQRKRERRERKRLGVPKDIFNYIDNEIRCKGRWSGLLRKYHPDKNKQKSQFVMYTQVILDHPYNHRRHSWTIEEYVKSSKVTKERIKELLLIGLRLGILNDIWVYKVLPFVIDTHMIRC